MALLGHRDGFGHGEGGEQPGFLEGAAQSGGGTHVGRPGVDVDTTESDASAVERQEARDTIEEGGLAGPVVTDQTQDLAVAQGEGYVLNGRDPPERLLHAVAFEDGRRLGRRRDADAVGGTEGQRGRSGGMDSGVRRSGLTCSGYFSDRVGASNEDGTQDVGTIQQVGRLAGEADFALF